MENDMYMSKENLDMIKRFRLMDDDFMAACFAGNIEAIQLVVRIIMDDDALIVTEVKTEYELKNLRRRSVRFGRLGMRCGWKNIQFRDTADR